MDSTTIPAQRLCTVAEAARYLRLTPTTIRRRVASGDLHAYRLGSRVIRVDLNELESLLDVGAPTSASAGDRLAEHVARVVAQAPPLSPAQRDRIAALLRGGAR